MNLIPFMWLRLLGVLEEAFAVVAAILLLAGCATNVAVQTTCDPPPVPPKLLEACEEAILPLAGTYEEFYGNAIANVVGPWARCVRKDDQLVAVVKYQQDFCAKLKADAEKKASKRWWEF